MKTIPELIITQIKNTYYDLVMLKEIMPPAENLIIDDEEIVKCLTKQGWKSIIRLLQTVNAEQILIKQFMETNSSENGLHDLVKKKQDILALQNKNADEM